MRRARKSSKLRWWILGVVVLPVLVLLIARTFDVEPRYLTLEKGQSRNVTVRLMGFDISGSSLLRFRSGYQTIEASDSRVTSYGGNGLVTVSLGPLRRTLVVAPRSQQIGFNRTAGLVVYEWGVERTPENIEAEERWIVCHRIGVENQAHLFGTGASLNVSPDQFTLTNRWGETLSGRLPGKWFRGYFPDGPTRVRPGDSAQGWLCFWSSRGSRGEPYTLHWAVPGAGELSIVQPRESRDEGSQEQ